MLQPVTTEKWNSANDFAKTQSHVSVEVIENDVAGLTWLVHETLEGLDGTQGAMTKC